MFLEFVIIPFLPSLLQYAHEIEHKLKQINNMNFDIEIDTNYNESYNSRINKWKKKDYDIIIINEDFTETNYIHVKFCEKKSKTSVMLIDEFIELISSFEEIPEHKEDINTNEKINSENNNKESSNNEEQTSGCIVC